MSRSGGIALVTLLLVAGLALPAQSQEEAEGARRWPYFEAEHLILPPPGAQRFGHEVDTDGERILVAARDAAHLYARQTDGGGWRLEETLEPPSGGPVLAVSLGDGHAAVATADRVHVWRLGDGWSQSLDGVGAHGDVLLRDGYLFVSEPRSDAVGDLGERGEVRVHRAEGSAYALRQTLLEPSSSNQRIFGADLAVRDATLVVGAPAQPFLEQAAPGSAHVYRRQGTTWSLEDTIETSRGGDAESSFGHKVATTGDAVVVSASTTFFAAAGDDAGSGWVGFYERGTSGWRRVQEESTDATAIAAREDAVLAVDWWWSVVTVHLRSGDDLRCYPGPWCGVGHLGGWSAFRGDSPFPEALALHGRVAVLGAPSERVDDETTGAVLAYYDNALPRAVGLPQEPVQDEDEDGRERVTLDGSHSFDPDGEVVSHAWYRGGELLAREPFVDVDLPLGTHAFRLEVVDDLGGVGEAEVAVVVQAPQLLLEIRHCCNFFGGGVPPERPVYLWAEVQDHRAGIKHWDWDLDGDGTVDSTEANPRHAFPHGGTWTVTLTVTNEAGDQMTASHAVEVRNRAPTADAGRPHVVPVEATGLATVLLDGGASTDPDGTIRGYEWLRRDPVAGTYSSAASGRQAEVQVPRGVNQFLLRVTDDDGARSQAHTTVIAVNPGQNQTGTPPTVAFTARDLGDRRLLLEDHSEPGDAAIVAWTWGTTEKDQATGDRQHVLAFEEPGDQQARLTVYDADGRVRGRTDPVHVGDGPPELSAWPLAGTVPVGAHVVMLARADDEAPGALAWRWRVDGADYSDHQDAGRTFTELGNHTVSVQVTDDRGHSARLDGWIDVVSEEAFRERFGNLSLEDVGNGTLGVGVFEPPDDEALQEELDRRAREASGEDADEEDDDGEEDEGDDEGPTPLAATVPETPGVAPVTWAFVAIGVALAALAAVEAERQRRRRARRRARYEAAMRARLERRQPARPGTRR